MTDGVFSRDDERTSPRFVPKDRLTMFLAGSRSPLIHGDVKDLSELGACVRGDTAIDSGGEVTINVRNGYSFLFRARGRVVWRAPSRRPHESVDCSHGIVFTKLSPFTRKLIRRLGGLSDQVESSPPEASLARARVWDSDSDPDLQILFRAERSPAQIDRQEVLSDPLFDPTSLLDGIVDLGETPEKVPGVAPSPQAPPEPPSFDGFMELDDLDLEPVDSIRFSSPRDNSPSTNFDARALERDLNGGAELSGNLGYFDTADVLQMLEARRATGVLYIDGPCSGEIQLLDGRIGGCFSESWGADEAAFHLIVARDGRFHFVPDRVLGNVQKIRTTTQVLLEAQLKRDLNKPPSDR